MSGTVGIHVNGGGGNMARSGDRKPPQSGSDPQLESRVAALESEVDVLKGQVQTLQDQVVGLQASHDSLVQEVGDLNESVADLDNRLTTLETGTPPEQPPDTEQPPKSLQDLVANGGTVQLTSGTYHDTAVTTLDTIVIGNDTILSGEGVRVANDKGLFNAVSGNLTLRKLAITGVSVPDGNGCCCKPEAGTTLTIDECEIYGNQMGVLTAYADKLTIINSYFHDSGNNDGLSHEIYCQANALEVTNSRIFAGPQATHAVKSRSMETHISGCHLLGSNGSQGGSVVNVPDGGNVLIEDTTIENQANAQNNYGMTYTTESTNKGVGTVTLRRVTITAASGSCGFFTSHGGALVIEDCTYTSDRPPAIEGWSSVLGQFTPA